LVRVRVRNWACIYEVDLELAPLTVLMGPNASGKSSLAYAIYYYSKLSDGRDPHGAHQGLDGEGLEDLVRRGVEGPAYPLVVGVDSGEFVFSGGKPDATRVKRVWSSSFLLPSQRISHLKLALANIRYIRGLLRKPAEALTVIAVLEALREAIFHTPPMKLALEDLLSLALGGRRGLEEVVSVEGVGELSLAPHVLLSMIEVTYRDPFLDWVRLPGVAAPDGALDSQLIAYTINKVPEGSLVVIEEPEIHKNPRLIVGEFPRLFRIAAGKGVTLIMTTHTDLIPLALAKAVEESRLKAEDRGLGRGG
jgi:hypothetical protein